MKKPYVGISFSNYLTNSIFSSFASYAKMICVMLCLQLVCASASAASLSIKSQDESKIVFNYSIVGASSAYLKVIKYDDISKYQGKAENCPGYYTCTLTTNTTSTATVYTSSLANDTYLAAIIQDGKTTMTTKFTINRSSSNSYKTPAIINATISGSSIVYTYTLPTSVASPYIKVMKLSEYESSKDPNKCPAFEVYSVSSGSKSLTKNIDSWENGVYIIGLFNNGVCVQVTSAYKTSPQYSITGVTVDYASKKIKVSYNVYSSSTIQISGTNIASQTVSAGSGTVAFSYNSSLKTGTYTAEIKGASASNSKKSFSVYRSSCEATVNDNNGTLTVNYEVGGPTASAEIRLYEFGQHYQYGDAGDYTLLTKVSSRSGSVVVNTRNYQNAGYVVRVITSCGENATSSIFGINNPAVKVDIANNTSTKVATISFSNAPSSSYLKVIRKSDNQVMLSTSSTSYSVNYSSWSGGDYDVVVCNSSGKELVKKNFAVHKIVSLKPSGNYAVVTYEMGSFEKGSYTVFRFASATTGKIYNEVPVNYNQDQPSGELSIYANGPQFKTDTYVVSFVVEGTVYDSKKIILSY